MAGHERLGRRHVGPGIRTWFTTIFSAGSSAFGGGFLAGVELAEGDGLSIFFDDGIVHPVGLTVSFLTTPPAPIPVLASGFLLGGVLPGAGLVAAPKRKSQVWATPA